MKHLIHLIAIVLVTLNCSAQEIKKGYVIKGEITNFPAKSVYLVMMKRDAKQQLNWPVVDSAKVVNNKFTLNKDTVLETPAWAASLFYIDTISKKRVSISFLNNDQSPEKKDKMHGNLTLDNANILIKGNLKEQKGVTISGSRETDFQMKYGLLPGPAISKLDKRMDSLTKTKNLAQLAVVKKEMKSLLLIKIILRGSLSKILPRGLLYSTSIKVHQILHLEN